MTEKVFDCTIEFPNGRGYTPCTVEYGELHQKLVTMYEASGYNMQSMSPEDYNTYYSLENELVNLQASGKHLGESVKW